MTTQTMTNELSLDQLDSVSGGVDPLSVAAGFAALAVVIAAGAAGFGVGYAAGSSVKADENGNGDYRTGPQNSPNSPPNPFG
ncbi:MAG: class IIb bacteriocin, lactobin A/cerein 7B family [Cyanobacteria bacterium P01_B01_bin.77]